MLFPDIHNSNSMLSSGTRKLDLYDFFSVFIPGAVVMVALAPLLPESVDPTPLEATVPLLLGGFVVGRGIHVVAVGSKTGKRQPKPTENAFEMKLDNRISSQRKLSSSSEENVLRCLMPLRLIATQN